MNGQTSIEIPIDLSDVRRLTPGDSWGIASDTETEVYVVQRRGPGKVDVIAFAISADRLEIKVRNQ